jgi:hypothetical protein
MALQVQERNAAIGAGVAAGLPAATNLLGLDLEGQVVSLADAIFEGDVGSASFAAGMGFTILGGILVLSAWIGPLNGNAGMAAMGVGMGMWGLGAESFNVGGGS